MGDQQLVSETIEDLKYFGHLLLTPHQRRYAFHWLRSRKPGYLMATGTPWLTFDAIYYIKNKLPANARVFEYGSGASTLFWLNRGAQVISIEHDLVWFTHLRNHISRQSRLDLRFVPPVKGNDSNLDIADPYDYASGDIMYKEYSFKQYVCSIAAFPDEYFDIVLIDGRARPSCIAHSVHKVKPGGILILDNAERPYYTKNTGQFLQNFQCTPCFGVAPVLRWMVQTNCYLKV